MSRSSVSKKAVSALIFSAAAFACAGAYAQDHMRTQTQTPIYGSQLMTDAERVAYQSKMRSLKTTAEKEAFRLDHHEQMKVRAAEKGLTLPDAPMMNKSNKNQPASGMGQGSAGSAGSGTAGGGGGKGAGGGPGGR